MVRNIFEGSEFLLFDINNNPIALSKNCALKVNQNLVDITTKDSNGWQENISALKNWSIEFEGLVSYKSDEFNTAYFLNKYNNAEPFFIQFGVIQDNFTHTFWGEVAIENIDISADNGDVTTYSGNLKGIGTLEFRNEGAPIQNAYLKVESDPVFRGSPSFNITNSNKNDWFEAYNKSLTEIGFSTIGNQTTLKVKLRDGSVYSSFFNQNGGGEGNVDLSNYYNKSQSDLRFQPLGNYVSNQYLSDYYFTKVYSDSRYYLASNPSGFVTSAFVDSKIAELVGQAPSTLDTLNELAQALGDDPNFATTVSSQIGLKANSADVFNKAESNNLFKPINWLPSWSDIQSRPTNLTQFTNDLGLGSGAYSDKTRFYSASHPNDYFLYNEWDGTYWQLKSNHPASVNVGNANNATNWGGRQADLSAFNPSLGGGILGVGTDGVVRQSSDSYIKSWLGLGSAAFVDENSFIKGTSTSSLPTNFNFAIGYDGNINFIQSHNSKPLYLNPLGNRLYLKQVTVSDELVLPSTQSSSNGAIWVGTANNTGTTNPIIAYLKDLQDVDFTNLSNGQSIQYDTATGKWKNVSYQIAGDYANRNGSNAYGNWNINITGNAGTATNTTLWNGNSYVGTDVAVNTYMMAYGSDGAWHPTNAGFVRDFIGFSTPSNYHRYNTFTADANTVQENTSNFTYAVNAPFNGPLVHFGASTYGLQLNASYGGGARELAFRARNGDTNTWKNWETFWHSGNMVSPSVSAVANTLVQRDENGYTELYYTRFTNVTENPVISDFMVFAGDAYGRKASLGHVKNSLGINDDINATASTLVRRDPNGYIYGQYFNMAAPTVDAVAVSDVVTTAGDGFLRRTSFSALKGALGVNDGSALNNVAVNSELWKGYTHDMNSVINSNPALIDYLLTVQSDKVSKSTPATIKSKLATSLQDVTNVSGASSNFIKLTGVDNVVNGKGLEFYVNPDGLGVITNYDRGGTNTLLPIRFSASSYDFSNGNLFTNQITATKYVAASRGFKSTTQHGLVGNYDEADATDKIIWTIGDTWNDISNMYGISYQYSHKYGSFHSIGYRLNGALKAAIDIESGDIYSDRYIFAGSNIYSQSAVYADAGFRVGRYTPKMDIAYDHSINQMYIYGYDAASFFSIYTGGGNERLRILSNGYVGISNSTPTDLLDIKTPNNGFGITLTKTTIVGQEGAALTFKNVVNDGTYQMMGQITGRIFDGSSAYKGGLVFRTVNNATPRDSMYIAPDGLTYINESLNVGGRIVAGGTNDALRLYASQPYMAFFNNSNTSRFGYIQHTGAGLYIASDIGDVHVTNALYTKNLVVGEGQNGSYITMSDTDNGDRLIHCNTDRIGFLNSSGSWGSWCDNTGNWLSNYGMAATDFSINGTATYLNSNGLTIQAGNGNGIGFWSTTPSSAFSIWMGDVGAYGGNIRGISSNDYNMYFRMDGNNRGYSFMTGNGTYAVQISNNRLDVNGSIYSNGFIGSNYGAGLVGVYSSTRYQEVFSMGEAYRPTNDGTTLSNMYGIAWTHSNVGGQSIGSLSHQALFVTAGVTQTAIGTGIWTIGDITGQGKVETPIGRHTAKMVIPTYAPTNPENGCIWIS